MVPTALSLEWIQQHLNTELCDFSVSPDSVDDEPRDGKLGTLCTVALILGPNLFTSGVATRTKIEASATRAL